MCKRAHYMLLPWRLTWRLYITCSCAIFAGRQTEHIDTNQNTSEKNTGLLPDVLSGRKGKSGNEGHSCAITEPQEYKNTDAEGARCTDPSLGSMFVGFLKKLFYSAFYFTTISSTTVSRKSVYSTYSVISWRLTHLGSIALALLYKKKGPKH